MNNNPIFGGELKERKIDKYIEDLDEERVDAADPFLFYKLTGENQNNLVPKITVANMAVDGVRRLTKVSTWNTLFCLELNWSWMFFFVL